MVNSGEGGSFDRYRRLTDRAQARKEFSEHTELLRQQQEEERPRLRREKMARVAENIRRMNKEATDFLLSEGREPKSIKISHIQETPRNKKYPQGPKDSKLLSAQTYDRWFVTYAYSPGGSRTDTVWYGIGTELTPKTYSFSWSEGWGASTLDSDGNYFDTLGNVEPPNDEALLLSTGIMGPVFNVQPEDNCYTFWQKRLDEFVAREMVGPPFDLKMPLSYTHYTKGQ